MGTETPKQYLTLRGRPVIAHTVERLASIPRIRGVVVVLSAADRWWTELDVPVISPVMSSVLCAEGGAERCHSVLNGLQALAGRASAEDWVLVHDAVRPCLRRADVERLIAALQDHPVGGLLGVPVRDTMKRAGRADEVQETVSRNGLWHALTPQMFRLGALEAALRSALAEGRLVTDEAQAMELTGARPRMIEGSPDNIKITRRQDMALAELYLIDQEQA